MSDRVPCALDIETWVPPLVWLEARALCCLDGALQLGASSPSGAAPVPVACGVGWSLGSMIHSSGVVLNFAKEIGYCVSSERSNAGEAISSAWVGSD